MHDFILFFDKIMMKDAGIQDRRGVSMMPPNREVR